VEVRKSDKIYRNSEFLMGVLDGSVPKPVAPLQFPAKPLLMAARGVPSWIVHAFGPAKCAVGYRSQPRAWAFSSFVTLI
jgi:hypothetical protein